ncbi:unnamed protein product [Effrenium voratum]|nr:unnamed protein product [Effrenium voratum]
MGSNRTTTLRCIFTMLGDPSGLSHAEVADSLFLILDVFCGRNGPCSETLTEAKGHRWRWDISDVFLFRSNDRLAQTQEPGRSLIHIPSTGPGYRGVSDDSNFAGDRRESFNLRMPQSMSNELCGMGENRWPSSAEWNEEFRSSSEEYFQLCFQTCSELRRALAHEKCLGPFLGSEANSDRAFARSSSLLGFTHYNYNDFKPSAGYVVADASEQVFGIRPHQDDGLCTLLYTDGQPGLEYAKCRVAGSMFFAESCRSDEQFSKDILWEEVPFLPGHWIVNLGTDLFRWAQQRSKETSDCRSCKATLHRVVPKCRERYSMPFFYEPNLDAMDPCQPHKKRYEYLIEDAK